ncbi:MAG: hypothetical protein V3R66_05540 [Rhodospirillales bacterium]
MSDPISDPMSNIQAVAHAICSRQLAHFPTDDAKLAADVSRQWHCVAVELEAGRIGEAGNQVGKFSFDEGLEAYRDWSQRHPENKGQGL